MRTLIHFARALADLGDAGIAHFARAYSLRDAQSGHHELNRLVAALAVLQIVNNARAGDLPLDAAQLLHEAQNIGWLWGDVQLMILQAHEDHARGDTNAEQVRSECVAA
jgi:hypothetical protein